MKRSITILFLAVGLASSLSAHHFSANDDAGANIPEMSPHLTMIL